MNEVVVRLEKHGKQLITRQEGHQVRNHIENLLKAHDCVIVDFSGLELVTPSFADESFGRLILAQGRESFKSRVRPRRATHPIKHLISVVLANRLGGVTVPARPG